MIDYTKTAGVELAVARWFNPRQMTIVPNVSWGLDIHECDLLVLSRAGYAYEVEIKVSKSDLRADKKKRHGHNSHKIKRLWFAIPECLEDSIDDIPGRAGVLTVDEHGRVEVRRQPEDNEGARKLSDYEKFKLVRLATLRMWDLKEKLLQ